MKCMLKTLFKRCKQHQVVCKKQTCDIAVANSDNLADLTVTFYPIHIIEYEEDR